MEDVFVSRRRLAALIGLVLVLAACGGEDGGTVTVVQTQTVAAPAASEPAPPSESASPGTTWVAPEPTDATTAPDEPTAATTAPDDSTADTTAGEPATDGGPEQFTLGGGETEPVTTEEDPPVSTIEPPADTTPDDPGVERPADFPTKREARLLALLYGDIANQCTRTAPDEVTKGANASVYCDLRAGDKVQTWYESFPSVAAMRKAYDRFRAGRGIGPNVRSCLPSQSYPAEAPWFVGDESNTLGRLLCFVENGDVWLIWGDDRYSSLGWAVNRGGKKKVVWDYWRLRGLLNLVNS